MQKSRTGFRVPFQRMVRQDTGTPDAIYVNVTPVQLFIHYGGIDPPHDPIAISRDPAALRDLAQGLIDVADYWERRRENAFVTWP